MSVQKKLYTSAQRKLVWWCIAAMLFMSTSFMAVSYLVSTNWLADQDLRQMHSDRLDLIFLLLAVQGAILAIGVSLSFWFARRVLRPIRQAHQAQAEFAANAHHQLRTPIAVMQAEVDTALLRKNQRPEDYKRILKSLLDELSLLRTIGEQLLLRADGAITSGKIHPTSQDLADLLVMLKRRHNIHIATAIDPGLRTTMSQEELAICLETMLDNSIKHAGKYHKELRVQIELKQHENSVRLVYRDNGKGIAGGEEKRVFDRHFRGSRAVKSQTQGNGLGLAILTDSIKAHAGTLAAANIPRGGLQIVVSLPKR